MPRVHISLLFLFGFLGGLLLPEPYVSYVAIGSIATLIIYALIVSYSSGSMRIGDDFRWFNDFSQMHRMWQKGATIPVSRWLVLPLIGVLWGALLRLLWLVLQQA